MTVNCGHDSLLRALVAAGKEDGAWKLR